VPPDLLSQVLGPAGALVLACAGLVALWRQSRKDMAAKDVLFADLLVRKDADIAFERARTAAAEARLEALGGLLKDATLVMDKSIALTEKALDRHVSTRGASRES
jgi:hypothetical protein